MDFLEAIEHDQAISARLARNPGGRPAQGYVGRNNVKLECPECGFHVRTSSAQLNARGSAPTCCAPMILPNMRDRLAVDWSADDAYHELGAMTPAYRRELLTREGFDNEAILGFRDYLEPAHNVDRSGARANRCAWEYGYCQVYVSGRYCAEHEQDRYGRHS